MTFLFYESGSRSPEMRHEIGEATPDPVVFMEHEGRRIVAGPQLEADIFASREDVVDEYWTWPELGYDELIADESLQHHMFGPELVLRSVTRLGVSSVVVPPTLHVLVADRLRDGGITLDIDAEAWSLRRRRKNPWELEGSERAQRAADTAMLGAAHMLREAEPTASGELRFEGEILTAELIRESMQGALGSDDAESQEILIQSGDACLRGHDPGRGPILPDASLIIDVFPRDRRTGAHSDMTRTFVPGSASPELKKLHTDVRAALELALDCVKPGADDVYRRVADLLSERGHETYIQRRPGATGPLKTGFFHGLGHGVGLEVHEKPSLGVRSDALVAGDVIAVEPGLYYPGIGGVRLEDTVLVTDSGIEHFTDPYPYDLEP